MEEWPATPAVVKATSEPPVMDRTTSEKNIYYLIVYIAIEKMVKKSGMMVAWGNQVRK